MATTEEITAAIQAGMDRVNATFGALSDDELATKVHDGENGWTAKQILAHMAGRGNIRNLLGMAASGAELPDMRNFDINTVNQQIVDARADKSRDELLTEFNEVHTDLKAWAGTLDDNALARTLELPMGTRTVAEMLMGSGGSHQIMHTQEVETALGK